MMMTMMMVFHVAIDLYETTTTSALYSTKYAIELSTRLQATQSIHVLTLLHGIIAT